MLPLEEELSLRLGDRSSRILRRDDAPDVERIAAALGLRGDDPKVARDARRRLGRGAKTLQLRVASVAARATEQHCLREQGFAPQCNEADGVEMTRMDGPDAHEHHDELRRHDLEMPLSVFRSAADVVLLVHLAFVVFVVLGGLLALRWPRVAWVHVPVALYGAVIEFVGFICPLTPLEIWLRRRGGEAGYQGGFIEHYVTAALYPTGLTREMQVVLGVSVLVVNASVYAVWIRRRRRRRASVGRSG